MKAYFMGMSNKTIVLGIGNDILTDDAIGPKLVNRLKEEVRVEGVSFQTSAVGGMQVIEMLSGFSKTIIVDAIRTADGNPVDVYHLTPSDFKETLHLSSFHDMNFLTALDFARKTDITIPEQIDIIAIEIVEDLTFSNEFSPEISSKYEDIFEEVVSLIYTILKS